MFGENGAGKSTLVKIIAGVLQPDSGRIFWDGDEIHGLDIHAAHRMGIRIIYQHLSTVTHMSVQENLSLGREPTRLGIILGRRERRQAQAALERVGIKLKLDRQTETLAVAERQLIEIARALQGDVKLLVMDEPTASLGDREVDRLFDVMRSLREQGVTIIFISHKLSEVMEISDRVTVLRDGHTIGTLQADSTSPEQLVEMMVGRSLSHGFEVQRSQPVDEVLLEAQEEEDHGDGISPPLLTRVRQVFGPLGEGISQRASQGGALIGDASSSAWMWVTDQASTGQAFLGRKLAAVTG